MAEVYRPSACAGMEFTPADKAAFSGKVEIKIL
jgi:hypothetical protein